jgi:hypothetical protein
MTASGECNSLSMQVVSKLALEKKYRYYHHFNVLNLQFPYSVFCLTATLIIESNVFFMLKLISQVKGNMYVYK